MIVIAFFSTLKNEHVRFCAFAESFINVLPYAFCPASWLDSEVEWARVSKRAAVEVPRAATVGMIGITADTNVGTRAGVIAGPIAAAIHAMIHGTATNGPNSAFKLVAGARVARRKQILGGRVGKRKIHSGARAAGRTTIPGDGLEMRKILTGPRVAIRRTTT